MPQSFLNDKKTWAIVGIEVALYLIFAMHSFIILDFSVFSSNFFTVAIFIIFTTIISSHLIRIKLVLWRIFLQTVLSTTSRAYAFFSHGYLVRAVAICISGFFALKVMFFLALLKPHTLDYVIVSIVTIFLFKGGKLVPENKFLLFRDDVQDVLRKYLSLFVASCLTAAACAVLKIFGTSGMEQFDSISQVLQISLNTVPSEEFSWPFRVLVRHLYAYDMLMEQLCFIPVVGKVFYCTYVIASDGAMTYFSIMLMLCGYRRGQLELE